MGVITRQHLSAIERFLYTLNPIGTITLDDLAEYLADTKNPRQPLRWHVYPASVPAQKDPYAVWVPPGKWRKGYWTGHVWVDHRGKLIPDVIGWAEVAGPQNQEELCRNG